MGSVREIARRASVSIATVSRVLNDGAGVGEETRQRVLAEVNASGYVRRVGLRTVAEGIALAYAGPGTVASPFDQALLAGIGRTVADAEAGEDFGNDLLIVNLKRSLRPGESPSALFARKGIKGVILRTTDEGLPLCRQLADEGFPSVVAGSRLSEGDAGANLSWVDGASRETSRDAVRHLVRLGHRRIGVIVNYRQDTDHRDRVDGWRDALVEAGLPADPGAADDPFPRVLRERATYEHGAALAHRWKAAPTRSRPTAVYVADPMPALGLLRGACECGVSVPGDLSVIGFDDGNTRRLTFPPMAAVCQDAAAIGEAAVDLLRVRIAAGVRQRDDRPAAPPPPERRSIPTTYEPGATVGPPPPRSHFTSETT